MKIDECVKAVCSHGDLNFYNEKFPYFTTLRFVSFINPLYAQLLNAFNNNLVFDSFSDNAQLQYLQIAIPKTKINSFNIFNNFVKKPVIPVKRKDYDKVEWVSKLFGVSKREAVEYLKNEEFEQAVIKEMF